MVAAVVMDQVFWELEYYGRKPTPRTISASGAHSSTLPFAVIV